MAMKKQDRKLEYTEVIGLMLKGKNENAFNKLLSMCAEDTGLYILADYKKAMSKLEVESNQSDAG